MASSMSPMIALMLMIVSDGNCFLIQNNPTKYNQASVYLRHSPSRRNFCVIGGMGKSPISKVRGQEATYPTLMLSSSASPFANEDPNLALIIAAEKGDALMIETLLSAGAEINFQHEDDHLKAAGYSDEASKGPSPLAASSMFGMVKAAEALIRLGADVNLATSEGMTPLHFAVIGGHAEIAKLLLDAGADVSLGNEFGDSPMVLAQGASSSIQALFGGK